MYDVYTVGYQKSPVLTVDEIAAAYRTTSPCRMDWNDRQPSKPIILDILNISNILNKSDISDISDKSDIFLLSVIFVLFHLSFISVLSHLFYISDLSLLFVLSVLSLYVIKVYKYNKDPN